MNKNLDPMSSFAISLFRAHQALMDCGEAIANKHDMSAARWKFLGALALAQAPLTVPQIAQDMGLTRQAVQRLADEMNELLYVEVHINPIHKRSKLYSLTRLGEELYNRINDDWLKIAEQLQAKFSPQEVSQSINNLDKFCKAFEDLAK
ncbi:MarR family winged helix-turn-helix transcriptional regulator [Bartonella sp. HY038]|uniref:MarR family winged helix-turn-helix transcriptional regulator n=1 Tax=Bartonella sp. HY038 TaxID=2759660 RepID=UPI0015F7F767|nr:MarR family winged helix-turn-helix transcriptional regulator [Bartonella sp. HY038]